jgi:hypothetical protein
VAALRRFSLVAVIDEALTCRLQAQANDEASAEQVRQVLTGAIAMARMMAGEQPALAGILDSVQATGTGDVLEVSFTVQPEFIDAAVRLQQALPQ